MYLFSCIVNLFINSINMWINRLLAVSTLAVGLEYGHGIKNYLKTGNFNFILQAYVKQMSSLSAQLAGIKANNNATILDKSKRRKIHSVSLVYDAREAATQDFESIYYDCLEAFNEMQSVDNRFSAFSKSLFSETSIRFDRMSQNSDQSAALNSAIEQFLMLIAGYLHLNPAFRALEWLVRRFHIQIHNTESLLMATLPWHESPEFVRILDIISVNNLPPVFQFLSGAKSNMQGPSRAALVRVLARDNQLFNAFNAFELSVIRHGCTYNRQLVFWSSLDIMLAMVYKEQGEYHEATDKMLPIVSDVIACSNRPQAQIASYMILATIVSNFPISQEIIDAAIASIVANWTSESSRYGLVCVSLLCASYTDRSNSQSPISPFSASTLTSLVTTFGSTRELVNEIIGSYQQQSAINIGALANKLIISVLLHRSSEFPQILPLVEVASKASSDSKLSKVVVSQVAEFALSSGPFEGKLNAALVEFIEKCGETLSNSQIDRLEIALQSSISIQRSQEADSEPNTMEVETDDASAKAEPASNVDINSILEEASNMDQSTRRNFTDAPLPQSDRHAQLWVKAASSGQARLDELRQVARVSPEAQLSFVLAIAIGPWPSVARAMAVRVAAATVTAVLQNDPSAADYQALLPFVLFLLSDRERRVRKEASQLLNSLMLMKPTSKSTKYDEFEGKNIAWLAKNDSMHIIKKLTESAEECVMDPEFVVQAARQAGKAAWCEFLVSNALHTRLPQILWITLRCLAHFKGVTKQLAPLLSQWNTHDTRLLWEQLCKDAKFPLSGVERSLISALRSNEPCGIEFLLNGMKSSQNDVNFANLAGEQLVSIWNEVLRDDTKERVAEELVDLAIDPSLDYDPREVLSEIQPFSANLFSKLLTSSASSTSNNKQSQLFSESSKRRRRRSSSTVQIRDGPQRVVAAAAERHLRRTTLILELIEKNTNQLDNGVAKLLATLFDILEELMALGEGSQLPVLYTEELLAGCMIGLVENLKAHNCSSRELNSLKVSTLVSCIRTSSSPQVQNRLLLLVAALATLCPDAVLHGVMPIFTFMGANTVRLDNDFSAHVIQQTIEQVIPALVAAGDKHEEIEMALLSFVAAFPHIPRHRRNSLFGALIKTLGPEQSLYKLLLLLGQRFAESSSTRRSVDAKALVYFATPFLRSFSASEQLHAMNSYVQFVKNANSDTPPSENDEGRFGLLKIRDALQSSSYSLSLRNNLYEFLARTAGEPEPIAGTQPLRITVSNTISSSSKDWSLLTDIIGALLDEIRLHNSEIPGADDLLVGVLELLPITRFVHVVLPLTGSSNLQVLQLISKKFDYEPIDDAESTEAARATLNHLVGVISASPTSFVIDTAESIIARFGAQLRDVETELLEQLVGQNGLLNSDRDVELSAITAINTICRHLGAAMYGFFARFFPVLCSQVKSIQNSSNSSNDDADVMKDDSDSEEESDKDTDLQVAVFALFAGLVRQMPRFMAPEAPTMLELVLASPVPANPRHLTLSVLQDKLDPRTMLTGLCHSWTAAVRGGISGITLFFTFLDYAIENIDRRELASEMSTLSSLVISCLGTRQQQYEQEKKLESQDRPHNDLPNQVEARINDCILTAFMRLNDRVVRPQFRKIVQWGFDSPSEEKQIAVLKFVLCVFDRLKSVVTNYAGYLLDDICGLLDHTLTTGSSNAVVRKLLFQILTVSFTYDQDDFWQSPARFDRVCDTLLSQLTVEPQTHGSLVVKSITALAFASSVQHRKRINDDLAQLLSGDASVSQKIWTIKVFSSLYRKLGEAWMVNLPQLVPIIAELLDDEEESVELETRRSLVPVIEGVLGESLDKYLA